MQSYPELTITTCGRPMEWLDRSKWLLQDLLKYDLKMQCMVCKDVIPSSACPRLPPPPSAEKAKKENYKIAGFLASCKGCLDKCRDHENYNMYFCNRCHYCCVFPVSASQTPKSECFDGTQDHIFTPCITVDPHT